MANRRIIEEEALERILRKETLFNILMDYGLGETEIWSEVISEFTNDEIDREVKIKKMRFKEMRGAR